MLQMSAPAVSHPAETYIAPPAPVQSYSPISRRVSTFQHGYTGSLAEEVREQQRNAREAGRLRTQAKQYLDSRPWITSLMHNESLLDLARRCGINKTPIEIDSSFLEQQLDVQVLELPSGNILELGSLGQLQQYVRDSARSSVSRVFFVPLENLSAEALGLVGSLLEIPTDALALHMVHSPPLHFSLPSKLDARPSNTFEYLSLVEGSVSTKKVSLSLTEYSHGCWTGVFLLKNQALDYRAQRSLEFYHWQPKKTRVETELTFSSALKESFAELTSPATSSRQSTNQSIKSVIEAVYPVVISECTAALDFQMKDLDQKLATLEECEEGSNLTRKERKQKLKDAQPHPSSLCDRQVEILSGLLRNLDETNKMFNSIGVDERQNQQHSAARDDDDGDDRDAPELQPGDPRPSRQQYGADLQCLISQSDRLCRDNNQFGVQRQAMLDDILPPHPPTSPTARYMQNRLDQIVFSTNPLLSLTLIATVYGMNMEIFVDGGLVSLGKYLVTALVFAVGVFVVTFFYEPTLFWITHSLRRGGTGRENRSPPQLSLGVMDRETV